MLKKGLCLAIALAVTCVTELFAATTPVREFVVADSPQSVSLDPLHTFTSFESQFYTAIYEGLVIANPRTLAPQPGVAMSWDVSSDGKTWKFLLRPDARFSNGDKLRAQDFVDTWMRMIDPRNNAEYSFLFDLMKGVHAYRTGAVKDPATVGFKALGDDVLQVELERPAAQFLTVLTHIAFLPLHHSLVTSTGWGNAGAVIGNGPFVLTSRSDTEIVLDKNPRYWDVANVAMDRIRIRLMDDANAATDGYITGRIQWVTQSLIVGNKLEARDRLELYQMFGTTYLYFVCDRQPWSDWRVRRGLALLVPWDKVRTKDLFYYPSEQLIPSIPFYPEVKGIAAQDIAEAKKLLADAGYPEGKGLPTLVVKVSADNQTMNTIVQTMADAWKSLIGLDVSVKQVDSADYLAETRKGDFTLAVSTWIGDYADPLTFLQLWTTGSNLNDAHFSDADYDKAVDEAISIMDNRKRYRRLGDAEQLLLTKAAVLPLDHNPAINLINTDAVGGWYSNPLDIHPFKFLTFKARATPPGIAMAR
ncbi:MAG TPA: peptide ABC transporter substrate-binding protein [Spirochaetia bacterium]